MRRTLAIACLGLAGVGIMAAPMAMAQTAKKKPVKPRSKPKVKPRLASQDFATWDEGGLLNNDAPTARPTITASWMVGTWGLNGCRAPEFYKRIRAGGRFTTQDETGTWRLQFGQRLPVLALSFRREGDEPGRSLRVQELALTRDGNDRMQLNVGWWVRCSRNPDAPLR